MVEIVNRPYAKAFETFATARPDVLCLSADLTSSCEVDGFRDRHPEQFLSLGMAEQNMLSFAGGLAMQGYRPFIHTFSVFLYRRPLLDYKGRNVFVKVTLDGVESDALFDTGAALSVVDRDFVAAHPDLFKAKGAPTYGKDAAGKDMAVQLHKVKSLELGGKTFEGVWAVGVDFTAMRDVYPPGAVFVAGYNLIAARVWTLDVDGGYFTAD